MVRALIAALTAATLALPVACLGACSGSDYRGPYGAQAARLGEARSVLGWNMAVSNLRWDADYVLIDVDAAPTDPGAPHAEPKEIRFGLYGALNHPMEATGIGSCNQALGNPRDIAGTPLSAPAPNRLTGTVCLGPLKDRSAVRGVYTYSPRDRIADTAAAYPAAFPSACCPPTRTTPVWWSRPPAFRRGAPTELR